MIWLLRHGEATGHADDDAARPLTAKGERQSRLAGAALVALDAGIEACLTSPKVRALDTARLACEALGVQPEVTEALRGGDFDPETVAAGRGTVLLVGHEPDLSRALQLATGARARMRKGGLAAIEGAMLVGLLDPAAVRSIAQGGR